MLVQNPNHFKNKCFYNQLNLRGIPVSLGFVYIYARFKLKKCCLILNVFCVRMCAYWSYHSFDIILMLPWNIKKSIPTVRCIQTVIQCYSVKINTSLIMMRECPYIVQTAHSSGPWVVVHFELCSEQLVAGAGGQRWDAIKKSGAHSMQGQMHAPLMR